MHFVKKNKPVLLFKIYWKQFPFIHLQTKYYTTAIREVDADSFNSATADGVLISFCHVSCITNDAVCVVATVFTLKYNLNLQFADVGATKTKRATKHTHAHQEKKNISALSLFLHINWHATEMVGGGWLETTSDWDSCEGSDTPKPKWQVIDSYHVWLESCSSKNEKNSVTLN